MFFSPPPPELPASGVLASVSYEDRIRLSKLGEYINVSPGKFLISEGAEQNRLYIVVRGMLKIRKADVDVVLAQISRGGSIGEINLFDPASASASAIAAEESLVWGIDRDGLNQFLVDGNGGVPLLVGLISVVAKRIRDTNDSLKTLRPQIEDAPGLEGWLG
ncbi:MAG: CRP/FNR family cyclic AMP-dependent transcriptional regulator [Verrucomicrobiales bacterium]|jgi:CRP/FNR family cyclic AMP-dependent transcriptional regulator